MNELKIEELTAIVDSREQLPYDLHPMRVEVGGLYTGDYSIKGLEHQIAVERKSLSDLIGCIGNERKRFERELSRLRSYETSAVVVEATWCEIFEGNWRSRISINSVVGSLASWISKGHTFTLAGNRASAQIVCQKILFHAAKRRWNETASFREALTKEKK